MAIRVLALFLFSVPLLAQTVTYDSERVTTAETILTPSNVWKLALVGSYSLDGAVFAQPLFVAGSPNLLIVATMNNSVYALNADSLGSVVWSSHFGSPWAVGAGAFFGIFYGNPVGILATPVSDGTYIYVVTADNTPVYTLRKIALSNGAQSTSIAISGSVSGTGAGTVGGVTDDTTGGNVNFHASWELQRTALMLVNGNVYFAFGAAGDEAQVWHGWVFSYRASDLAQQAVFCTTPNANGGGAWEAGGFAVDGSGNLYFPTGNGSWDGLTSFSQSVLKLSPALSLLDWFTPSNESATSGQDADLSSGHVILIPGTIYLTLGSKDGRVWLIDTTNMGHQGGQSQVLSTASFTPNGATGTYGGFFWGNVGYFPLVNLQTYAFSFSGSTYSATPVISSATWFMGNFSASSNSGANSILWAMTARGGLPQRNTQNGILRAMNPATMDDIWTSGTQVPSFAKYVYPLVQNGKVYVPTNGQTLLVFGIP